VKSRDCSPSPKIVGGLQARSAVDEPREDRRVLRVRVRPVVDAGQEVAVEVDHATKPRQASKTSRARPDPTIRCLAVTSRDVQRLGPVTTAREEHAREVLSEAGILFGSRASGEARDGSDADVAVMAGREVGLLERRFWRMGSSGLFGVPDVDLAPLDDASLELRGAVVQEGRTPLLGG
jgi:predicted nucleotidyltransferase